MSDHQDTARDLLGELAALVERYPLRERTRIDTIDGGRAQVERGWSGDD
ncbi:hypothetical protein [Actinoplanes aureus]|uniref:Uncharacterized protein n=1 Tax=Actinoplanes aureus TaxID=2792083 RepID=A0A931CKB1_9ACTN|nr:hypothetical protein [Actinoplanes aureus]MBG0568928.1 hypothetical protein [Actinoplanes aureus]